MVSEETFNALQKQNDELWQLQNRTRDERESYSLKLQDMTAERDRLAAENAELKARYLHVAELNHNQVSMVRADCAALAAANATLDALREAVHPDERRSWSALDAVHAILYPQPAASIRDIAGRHGFEPMPSELGQQNVNDHTTPAALAEEKKNG